MPGAPASRLRTRGQIETVIRVAAPLLDLLLAVGERVSRLLEPEAAGYAPARIFGEGESAPRGLGSRARRERDRSGPRG